MYKYVCTFTDFYLPLPVVIRFFFFFQFKIDPVGGSNTTPRMSAAVKAEVCGGRREG